MNTRTLSQAESDNLTALNEAGLASTLVFVTATGLTKSILDATEPMREMLDRAGVHSYGTQRQGDEGKVTLDAMFLDGMGQHEVRLSLYRPKTKRGDPRMWFYSLGAYVEPNDVLAVFVVKKRVHAINLTRTPLAGVKDTGSELDSFFRPLWQKAYSVASELLQKLRDISALGPLRSIGKGDTAIGLSIETALGIKINSSKKPDYKGIEIKSSRLRQGRTTLFACVPDWNISNLKSIGQLLNAYGYQRDDDFALICTVSTKKENPRGLKLQVQETQRLLEEVEIKLLKVKPVVAWKLSLLEERLTQKHRETFWVKADSEVLNGTEYFHLQSVIHTRDPNVPQFERLLLDGAITLDHLITRTHAGKLTEKGPLFRIKPKRIRELFLGEPKEYSLIS